MVKNLFFIVTVCFLEICVVMNTYAKVDNIIGNRQISFVNQCPFPVWFGMISGSAPSKLSGTYCNTIADCNAGSVCVQTGTIKQCFWSVPAAANNNYQLAPNGGRNTVNIPVYQNSQNIIWSGAVAGRTNCTSAGCETADCGSGVGKCPEGKGFNQPATQAEFALLKASSDFYDVEVINGMNIPVSMSPNISSIARRSLCKQGLGPCDNPYNCGNPGDTNPPTLVGRCTWDMTPPVNDYKWVAKGGGACIADNNCVAPTVCGISFDPTRNPQLLKTCGKLLGYWTANQICGINSRYGAPFNCSNPLPAPQQNLTMTNLYGCAPIDTCYSNGSSSTCCGCVNWDQIGLDVPSGPITQQCVNSNPFWVANVQPGLVWIKKTCPTVYTYPYDDKSSTFTCQILNNGVNNINYTITFCPGGKTGGVTG